MSRVLSKNRINGLRFQIIDVTESKQPFVNHNKCKMESEIKAALETVKFERFGRGGGGCISSGQGFITDHGKVFVKVNEKSQARRMFDGEFASLKAIHDTNTITVPKPLAVLDNPKTGGAVFVMEYLDLGGGGRYDKELGEQLARMHLHNRKLGEKQKKEASSVHKSSAEPQYVDKFGFHITTCCGYLPQNNEWCDDWPTFYARKLNQQITMLQEERHEKEAVELWEQLQRKIPKFFEGLDIKPSLVHGDLWGGNVSTTKDGPAIFDPASFYGHDEYDFGIAAIFGGFPSSSFRSYHTLVPKASGFDTRLQLYQLFHYLNHWNHFGSGYRGSSMGIMRSLLVQ